MLLALLHSAHKHPASYIQSIVSYYDLRHLCDQNVYHKWIKNWSSYPRACCRVRHTWCQFNSFSQIAHISLGIFTFYLFRTLNFPKQIFSLFAEHSVYINCWVWSSLLFENKYALCGPAHQAIHMCLWNTMGFFETFVTNLRNGSLLHLECKLPAGSICGVSFAACLCSTVVSQHCGVTPTSSDSDSAEIVMSIATGSMTCLLRSYKCASYGSNFVTFAFFPLPVSPLLQNAWVQSCILLK